MQFAATFLVAACLITQAVAQCPHGIRDRKEIRALSAAEWTAFVNAVKTTMAGPAPTTYDRFVKIHIDNKDTVHNVAIFFTWHRYYLREFEKELQKSNPNVMLPYWNWAFDSQAPEKSIVFRSDRLGGNGKAGGCVTDGAFANWKPYYPSPHCLQRQFDAGSRINSFYSSDVITRTISQSQSYDALRRSIEFAPHGSVHVGIGGDMALMQSPNDPVFWLHHGYIDKIYARWQQVQPAFVQNYAGPNADGSRATANDALYSFQGARVRDVFDTKTLCYTYAELPAAGTAVPQQPSAPQQPSGPSGSTSASGAKPQVIQPQVTQPPKVSQAAAPPVVQAARPTPTQVVQQTQWSQPAQQTQWSQQTQQQQTQWSQSSQPSQQTWKSRGGDDSSSSSDDERRHHGRHGHGHGRHLERRGPIDTNVGVPGDDRSNLVALRIPRPLPKAWLDMNNKMPEAEVRDHETKYAKVTDDINSIDGYIPPCALWMREDLMDSLKGEVDKFYGTIHGKYVETKEIKSITTIKETVRKQCGGSVRVEVDEYKDSLIKIIGTVLPPPDAASYPFTKPHTKDKVIIALTKIFS